MNNENPQETQPQRPFFKTIFLAPEEPRLRAGWRLAIQLIFLMILFFGLQYIIGYYLPNKIPARASYIRLVSEIFMLFAITGSVFASRKLLDNRSFASLGLKINTRAWLDLAAGIGIAALMMGFIFLTEIALGWLNFQNFAWEVQPPKTLAANILLYLLIFLIVGWQEELLYRGYLLQNLREGLNAYWVLAIFIIPIPIIGTNYLNWGMETLSPFRGILALQLSLLAVVSILVLFLTIYYEEKISSYWSWLRKKEKIDLFWAVAFSSLFFARSHLGNPNFSIVSLIGLIVSLIGLTLSGAFLAYGYTSTQRLWLPIGLHIGWNFFEGVVFGFPVSGLNIPRLLIHSVEGPILWTGGQFGPEAGLILLPALAIGAFFIWIYATQSATQTAEVSEIIEENAEEETTA